KPLPRPCPFIHDYLTKDGRFLRYAGGETRWSKRRRYDMATFVLVGGAWMGAWVWKQVATDLRQRGHQVYPISLTGLGDRVHLARPEVNLDTHITDVINLIAFEDLDRVSLVGHSYAGSVIAGVADRIGDQLAQTIYCDTAPLDNGESMIDF